MIKGNNPEARRLFSSVYDNASNALSILPSEALSIPEVKKYIEEFNVRNTTTSVIFKNVANTLQKITESKKDESKEIKIDSKQFHYLTNVMRRKRDDILSIIRI